MNWQLRNIDGIRKIAHAMRLMALTGQFFLQINCIGERSGLVFVDKICDYALNHRLELARSL